MVYAMVTVWCMVYLVCGWCGICSVWCDVGVMYGMYGAWMRATDPDSQNENILFPIQATVGRHAESFIVRCVPIAPCDCVNKQERRGNVPIMLAITSHINVEFDFQ